MSFPELKEANEVQEMQLSFWIWFAALVKN